MEPDDLSWGGFFLIIFVMLVIVLFEGALYWAKNRGRQEAIKELKKEGGHA